MPGWFGLHNRSGFFYYGFYAPHWSYDGWGGPRYWWRLTHESKYSHAAIDKTLYKATKKTDSLLDYRQCGVGVQQSPIDIRASTWTKPGRHVTYMEPCSHSHHMLCP